MVAKTLFFFCATVALVQSVYGCPTYLSGTGAGNCGCGNNLVLSNGLVGASTLGCGNNLVLSNGLVGAGTLGCGASVLPAITETNGILSTASGSPTSPNGFSLASEVGLEGPVSVCGAVPFAGAVGLSGVAPTAGEATVAYSTAPGVGLTSVGCGQGIAGNAILGAPALSGSVYGNNLLSNNLLGGNLAGLGYSIGGCGCGY